ncbi:MAG: hypothetical protein WCQ60_02675 [bacterium]
MKTKLPPVVKKKFTRNIQRDQPHADLRGVTFAGLGCVGKDTIILALPSILEPLSGRSWTPSSIGTHVCRKIADEQNPPMQLKEFYERIAVDKNFYPGLDRKIDCAALEECYKSASGEGPCIIMGSRMIPALIHKRYLVAPRNPGRIMKILFTCGEDESARRMVKREFMKNKQRPPTEEEIAVHAPKAKEDLQYRAHVDATRFFEIYGIHDVLRPEYFDVVIPTDGLSAERQLELTCQAIFNFVPTD